MLFNFRTLLTVSILVTQISALAFKDSEVIKRDGVSAFKLGFDVDRSANTVSKRGEVPVTAENAGYTYFAKVLFGSEEDEGTVQIDTGSSDLWITTTSAGGPYDPSKSSTYKKLDEDFLIKYISGSASGTWAQDTISIGDQTKLQDFKFATASESQNLGLEGILGIGLQNIESSIVKYQNLPLALKDQGVIDKAGYSVYLNNKNATSGTILFGGIDKAKYEGDLVTVPITSSLTLLVTVDSIIFNGETIDRSFDAILDTGYTYTFLPTEIWKVVDEYFEKIDGAGDPDKYLEFSIGNVFFKVPFSDLTNEVNGEWNYGVGDSKNANSGTIGDNFLRHAYVVYNLEDKEISVAPVKYTDDTNIVPL